MKSRFPRLLHLICLATLVLAACSQQAQQMNNTAERLLTAVAEETPGAAETAEANASRTPAPIGPTATPAPPVVFARCISRAETQMRLEPNEAAVATASLQPSEIITAYGRTLDAKWILGWNKDVAYGWIASGVLGCTAPFEELKPTDASVLLITPTPEFTTTQIAEPGASPVTATLIAPVATETSLPAASDTPLPATQTPPTASATTLPATDTPVPVTSLPTASATSTAAPTNTPEATATTEPPTATEPPTPTTAPTATTAPPTATTVPTPTSALATATATSLPAATSLPQVTVIVRIITVTVIVTVTAPPTTPTLAPVLTATSLSTAQATQALASTPTVEQTSPTATTTAPSPTVVRELACVVTPGTPVNLRRGPSRATQLLGTLRAGAPFVATGRNEDGTWLYGATQRRTFGWLIATSVRCQGEQNELPVVNQ